MRLSPLTRTSLASLALLSGLSACSDGVESTDSIVPRVVPVYSPSTSAIPVPNDLLFADTTDLTLNIPVLDPTDGGDPPVVMNGLDGWSVGAPFKLAFSGPIDVSTAVPGGSIRIFKVTTAMFGGPISGVSGELPGSDYQAALASWDATGSTLEIRPTLPLDPQTTYMVVLTDGILAADGRPITTDAEYTLASSQPLLPPDHPFFPLQVLVLSMEGAAEAAGVDRDSIAMTFHFTTQSVGSVLDVISAVAFGGAAAEAAVIGNLCGSGMVDCSAGSDPEIPAAQISGVSFSGVDTLTFGGAGFADLYTGTLSVPYFLTAASNPSVSNPVIDLAPTTESWQARYPFSAFGGNETNLTAYNPLPTPTGSEQIPMLISVPKAPASKPAGGWPVTIFQHGITANRLSLLGVADSQANPFVGARVVVAIDMPLHGVSAADPLADPFFAGYQDGTTRERTFGLDLLDNATGAPGPDGIADASGAHMINLASLATARDNLRQAVSDLIHLNAVLGTMDLDGDTIPDIDTTNISFMGHSLGGMVGIPFLANTINSNAVPATLGMPGGGISKLLDASLAFGPSLQAALSAAGVFPGTEDYETFMWASQTVLDTVDPVHHIGALAASGDPIHLVEVVGGGNTGVADMVVPNFVADAPLSGTDPLILIANLESWTAQLFNDNGGQINSGISTMQGVVRFIEGTHASLVSPGTTADELAAFSEMGVEMATLGASQGAAINAFDTSVIQ